MKVRFGGDKRCVDIFNRYEIIFMIYFTPALRNINCPFHKSFMYVWH